MEENEKIKSTILRQLQYGASCRVHLHRECCRELGLRIVPKVNPISGNRTQICRGMSDSKFDKSLNELCYGGLVRKIRIKSIWIDGEKTKMDKAKTVEKIGVYAFYELTKQA